jgi:hypothetical protein
MNPADAAGLHRAMFAAIERRDLDALRGLFAVDATHTSSDGEPMTGPEPLIDEVRAFVEAFPDLTIDIRHQHVPDPSRSIIEYTFRGTHPHRSAQGSRPHRQVRHRRGLQRSRGARRGDRPRVRLLRHDVDPDPARCQWGHTWVVERGTRTALLPRAGPRTGRDMP